MDNVNGQTLEKDEETNGALLQNNEDKTKFCKHCGNKIPEDAVVCNVCGRQVEELKQSAMAQPSIVINNENTNSNTNVNTNINENTNENKSGKPKNKWVSFVLCLLLGYFGAHKFYEGKIGMGVLYLCTFGLCFVGVIVDLIAILGKPNPYYV